MICGESALSGAIRTSEEKEPGPELVAQTLLEIVSSPTPRLRYLIGQQAQWVTRFRRFLPSRLYEKPSSERPAALLERWLLASLGHEVVGELVEALEQRAPRPFSWREHKRPPSPTDLHFVVFEMEFPRNAHCL